MNNIKTRFTIKDLENLSGIKAHTIRIWEKRYDVLSPMRTDTNIRYYDIESLQKLLNITLLHKHGYKISKISKFSDEKIPGIVREIISRKSAKHHAINAFKMAMMNFDQTLFFNTYNTLLAEKSFREIFYEVVIPLLEEVGLLWQTGTITLAHEHFITNLITQKLLLNLEKVQSVTPARTDRIFVLFLPMNELHELGLMYINYELSLNGYKTIYLGESVPVENLADVTKFFDNITYVSYFTVKPMRDEVDSYLEKIHEQIIQSGSDLWVLGRMLEDVNRAELPDSIKVFTSIQDLVKNI